MELRRKSRNFSFFCQSSLLSVLLSKVCFGHFIIWYNKFIINVVVIAIARMKMIRLLCNHAYSTCEKTDNSDTYPKHSMYN